MGDFLTTGRSSARSVAKGELNRWARSKFKPDPKDKGEGGVFDMIKSHAAPSSSESLRTGSRYLPR